MPPRHLRAPTHSPTVRRVRTVGVLSAAVVVAAATASILLTQPTTGAPAHTTRDSAGVLDAAVANPTTAASRPKPVASPTAPKPTRPSATTSAPPAAKPSEKLLNFDFKFQPNFYYCAPAAAYMALTAHGAYLSQDRLASQLGTTTNGTNSAEDTTRVLNSVLSITFYQTKSIPGLDATPAQMDQLQADVVHAVSSGYAVVANIIGGATDAAGVWHDFPGGHYVTIVGYSDDGRTVKIADPSGMYGPGTYWISTINTANWIATRGYSA